MQTTEEHGTLEAGRVNNPVSFMLAGNATVTLVSTKTGVRFTYKICKAKHRSDMPETWFVSYLMGSNNEEDYKYLGMIRDTQFRFTPKSPKGDSPVAMAFNWTFNRAAQGKDTSGVEVWHAGKCGRCGRKLTVPESIATGLGPECALKMGA